MFQEEKLLRSVLEAQAADKAAQWLVALMTVTGFLIILSMFLGLTYFLAINGLRYGDLLARTPWQPAASLAVWLLGAWTACRSDDRQWHSFAAGTLVSGTAGMILFVLFHNPFFTINLPGF